VQVRGVTLRLLGIASASVPLPVPVPPSGAMAVAGGTGRCATEMLEMCDFIDDLVSGVIGCMDASRSSG
jgi:hypothetical protein